MTGSDIDIADPRRAVITLLALARHEAAGRGVAAGKQRRDAPRVRT